MARLSLFEFKFHWNFTSRPASLSIGTSQRCASTVEPALIEPSLMPSSTQKTVPTTSPAMAPARRARRGLARSA
eukprot:CAMPEP_0202083196 /NCGR_PEP_ID=MMETSP0964-20121228/22760_1 /ASSEMBLY_ACC=CAM_ASM_000500 /TAXON_ID=4773 /ORGANISM="Schizochytrium aggregatum, Strain ATCC28209" /LENGTH=73 /DNA_ID=CAMNT_0048650885 /DNA_START=325 /DNA_END=542 /DNA_ORIENTATION=-